MADTVRSVPPGIRTPARRVITNKAIGDRVNFSTYSTETSNEDHFTIRCVVQPGGGVPLHYHRNMVESFKVLKGVLTVNRGPDVLRLKVGEDASVPIGVVHAFGNRGEEECEFEATATLKEGVEKSVLLGFQQSLYILYGLANDGLCDVDAVSWIESCLFACYFRMLELFDGKHAIADSEPETEKPCSCCGGVEVG